MNWIIDNWQYIVMALCCVFCAFTCVMNIMTEPDDKRKDALILTLREWLLWAVVEAERTYGSGTGTLKLHAVYNLACKTFTWLPRLVTFEMFSEYVDDALRWFEIQLASNINVKNYVEGE